MYIYIHMYKFKQVNVWDSERENIWVLLTKQAILWTVWHFLCHRKKLLRHPIQSHSTSHTLTHSVSCTTYKQSTCKHSDENGEVSVLACLFTRIKLGMKNKSNQQVQLKVDFQPDHWNWVKCKMRTFLFCICTEASPLKSDHQPNPSYAKLSANRLIQNPPLSILPLFHKALYAN